MQQIAGFVDAEFASVIEDSLKRNGVAVHTSCNAERFEAGETYAQKVKRS